MIDITKEFDCRLLSNIDLAYRFIDDSIDRIVGRTSAHTDGNIDTLLDLNTVLNCGANSVVYPEAYNPIGELIRIYLCDNIYCEETADILVHSLLRMMLCDPNALTNGIILKNKNDNITVNGKAHLENPLHMLISSPWKQYSVHRLDPQIHLINYLHHILQLFMLMVLINKSALEMCGTNKEDNLPHGTVGNNQTPYYSPSGVLRLWFEHWINQYNNIRLNANCAYPFLLSVCDTILSGNSRSIQSIQKLIDYIISVRNGYQQYDHTQLQNIVREVESNIQPAEGRDAAEEFIAETGQLLINNLNSIILDIYLLKLRNYSKLLDLSLQRQVALGSYSRCCQNGKKGKKLPPELVNEILESLPRKNLNFNLCSQEEDVNICKLKMVLSVVLADELDFTRPSELPDEAIYKLENDAKNYHSVKHRLIKKIDDGYNRVTDNIDCSFTVRGYTFTLLHLAARNGDLDKVKILMAEGADIHVEDSDGCTALYYAIRNGNKEIETVLSEKISRPPAVKNETSQFRVYPIAAVTTVAVSLLLMYFTQLSILAITLFTVSSVLVIDFVAQEITTKLNELNCNNVVETSAHPGID